jgi:hypothetical protein
MCCQASFDQKKLQLVLEHASLTARHAAGDKTVVIRLEEIEAELALDAVAIGQIALGNYLGDY